MNSIPSQILPSNKPAFQTFTNKLLAGLLVILLSACTLSPVRQAPDANDLPLFVAPTISPTEVPPTPLPDEPTAAPAGENSENCTDGLKFIADKTIPDGTVIAPGATVDKRWEVENSGTCNWGIGYTLRQISGEEFSAATDQALVPARSGSRTEIRIFFTAPTETGTFRSAWQAFSPQGTAFGDLFYIEIIVKAE